MPEPLLLTHWRSPGDIVCFTAAIRDLATTYPGRFEIHVGGSWPELWQNNPHVTRVWGLFPPPRLRIVRVSYRAQLAQADHLRLHFITAFNRALSVSLGLTVPVLQPHGDLHLTDDEKSTPLIPGRYWYFIAGGKQDIQTKIWPANYSQRLADRLVEAGIAIVQGGSQDSGHCHPRLSGVHNMVGQTSLRDVLRLVYHAEGVICPVTFAMHAAAAFRKPCVVIAGGREPWWWEAYCNTSHQHFGPSCAAVRVPHRFLHTMGQLDCCHDGGCWKTQVGVSPPWTRHECVAPTTTASGESSPQCLVMLPPNVVADAVLSYYRDGTLAPL